MLAKATDAHIIIKTTTSHYLPDHHLLVEIVVLPHFDTSTLKYRSKNHDTGRIFIKLFFGYEYKNLGLYFWTIRGEKLFPFAYNGSLNTDN